MMKSTKTSMISQMEHFPNEDEWSGLIS